VSEIDAITRVVKVTVSEDRAHVLRAGAVALPSGVATVRVRGVAPVLADKTLRIDAGAAKVAAVAVERRVRALPPDGDGSESDALAARILASERALGSLDRAIDHAATRAAVTAERGVLAALGAGCDLAVGAYAEIDGDLITLRAMLGGDVEGEAPVFGEGTGRVTDAEGLGRGLGERLREGYATAGGTRLEAAR